MASKTEQRYIAYFLENVVRSADPSELQAEHEHILRVVERVAAAGPSQVVELLRYLFPFWETRGYYAPAEQYVTLALGAMEQINVAHWPSLLLYGGTLANRRWHTQQARELWERGLVLARQQQQPEDATQLLGQLGNLARVDTHFEVAYRYLIEGLEIARQHELHREEGPLLHALGIVLINLGQHRHAVERLEQGVALARAAEDGPLLCRCLIGLSLAMAHLGEHTSARGVLDEGLVWARRVGYQEGEGFILQNLGGVAKLRADYEEAVHHYRASLVLARTLGHGRLLVLLLEYLGETFVEMGRCGEALACFRSGLQEARQMGRPEAYPSLLRGIARVLMVWGLYRSVEAYLTHIATLARRHHLGAPQGDATTLELWAHLYLRLGRFAEAEEALQRAFSQVAQLHASHLFAPLHWTAARLAAAQGRCDVAREQAQRSIELYMPCSPKRAQQVVAWCDRLPLTWSDPPTEIDHRSA